mgnify:CR=1 FL=1|jgi:hypothetical protein
MNDLKFAAASRGSRGAVRSGSAGHRRRLQKITTLLLAICSTAAAPASPNAAVFASAPVSYSEPLKERPGEANRILRIINVEERAGVKRVGDLVRVPVFFASGECREIEQLAIVAQVDGAEKPVPFQADDIRRGPDGGVARAHLWFRAGLEAGERRRYHLLGNSGGTSETRDAKATHAKTGEIRFATDRGAVTFSEGGELRTIEVEGAKWEFGGQGAAPRIEIELPAGEGQEAQRVSFDGGTSEREVEWAEGPLFGKMRVRWTGPDETKLEQEFRIPRDGREVVVTTAVYPSRRDAAVVKENRLLEGRVTAARGGALKVVRVPAGIRHPLRAQHAYDLTALADEPGKKALLAVPLVVGGGNGRWGVDGDTVSLHGQRNLRRGKEGEKSSLFAFWTEVRLVPVNGDASVEALWSKYREHVQPLVAVVDEPGVTFDDLHPALQQVVREMKPIGWRQEAGRALVLGDEARAMKILTQGPKEKEADADALVRGAENARAKITNNGQRKVLEHEKGRAYGGLDPYHVTYTQSAAAALAAFMDAPSRVTEVNLAMARGVRRVGGMVDAGGSPYVDCFNRTLNMQMGAVLFGLTAGAKAGDAELVRFYRDLATAPAVLGVFGRGQRPYTGAPATRPDQTDYLYQAICDFWLRATEILGNEDLGLHPLAYSRFTDCVDVMADLYHGPAANHKAELPGLARANFYRGQAHTHRWLGWSAAPYIRLLEKPEEAGAVGATEALHYTHSLKGRWKNWPDLTFYVLADLLVREGPSRYERPELLDAPTRVRVQRGARETEIAWEAASGASGYRIYRSDTPGGPYRWLNSPHAETPGKPITSTRFVDAGAKKEACYVVTAVDGSGREGRWPERAAEP